MYFNEYISVVLMTQDCTPLDFKMHNTAERSPAHSGFLA